MGGGETGDIFEFVVVDLISLLASVGVGQDETGDLWFVVEALPGLDIGIVSDVHDEIVMAGLMEELTRARYSICLVERGILNEFVVCWT